MSLKISGDLVDIRLSFRAWITEELEAKVMPFADSMIDSTREIVEWVCEHPTVLGLLSPAASAVLEGAQTQASGGTPGTLPHMPH